MEKPPKTDFSEEQSPYEQKKSEQVMEMAHLHPVEDVLAHGLELCSICKTDPHAPGCNTELFHKEIEDSEVGFLFHEYENGNMVSLADIRTSISRVIEVVSPHAAEDEELAQSLKLLSHRAREIQLSVQRYVGSLVQFVRIRHQQNRLDVEDFKERMAQIDQRRRSAHDTLIESLRVYTTLVNKFVEEDVFPKDDVIFWHMGQPAPKIGEGSPRIVCFSEGFLRDRELIKDWAISAELKTMLEDITESQSGK